MRIRIRSGKADAAGRSPKDVRDWTSQLGAFICSVGATGIMPQWVDRNSSCLKRRTSELGHRCFGEPPAAPPLKFARSRPQPGLDELQASKRPEGFRPGTFHGGRQATVEHERGPAPPSDA